MSNDTLLQILDELKDVVKNGGMVTINDVGGISTFSVPDSSKSSQATVSLQDMIDELTNSTNELNKKYKAIKDKADTTKYDPTDDEECTDPVCEDGTGDGFDSYDSDNYELGGYDQDKDDEEDIDEVINKLYGERIELRSKIDKVSRFIAHSYVIDKIGKEQYHLLVLQMNAMSSYLNILTERINLLEYDRDNGLD